MFQSILDALSKLNTGDIKFIAVTTREALAKGPRKAQLEPNDPTEIPAEYKTITKYTLAYAKIGTDYSHEVNQQRKNENEMDALRNELAHATRATTLGEFSAALAHEINHPLGSILANAQAAERFLDQEKPDLNEIREIIAAIIRADRRARDVIQKLRALMKKTEPHFDKIKINDVINESLIFTKNEFIIQNIKFTKRFEKDLPAISGDHVQMQQVFLNLIINAVDSLRKVKKRELSISIKSDGPQKIIICVKDSGLGFDEKRKEDLFKPFFTTKTKGMGMGLAVNAAIIKAHKGKIWVENNKKGGVSFFVMLPIYKDI